MFSRGARRPWASSSLWTRLKADCRVSWRCCCVEYFPVSSMNWWKYSMRRFTLLYNNWKVTWSTPKESTWILQRGKGGRRQIFYCENSVIVVILWRWLCSKPIALPCIPHIFGLITKNQASGACKWHIMMPKGHFWKDQDGRVPVKCLWQPELALYRLSWGVLCIHLLAG